MQQPSSSAPSPSVAEPRTEPRTETVVRPDPGLARGKWEAPIWAFYVALAVVIVATAAYVALRMRARKQSKA